MTKAATATIAQRDQQSHPERFQQFSKTKMCKFNLLRMCSKGPQCPFAHSQQELRNLPDLRCTKLCAQMIQTGTCNEPGCTFAHSREELRSTGNLHKIKLCRFQQTYGVCTLGPKCSFAHSSSEIWPSKGTPATLVAEMAASPQLGQDWYDEISALLSEAAGVHSKEASISSFGGEEIQLPPGLGGSPAMGLATPDWTTSRITGYGFDSESFLHEPAYVQLPEQTSGFGASFWEEPLLLNSSFVIDQSEDMWQGTLGGGSKALPFHRVHSSSQSTLCTLEDENYLPVHVI